MFFFTQLQFQSLISKVQVTFTHVTEENELLKKENAALRKRIRVLSKQVELLTKQQEKEVSESRLKSHSSSSVAPS